MSFKELNIKLSYINHGDDNFVSSLINPALMCAKFYRRSIGFFSSSVLMTIMPSLPYFVKNGGQIQLIVSPNLSNDDVEIIDKGYKLKEEVLKSSFQESFEEEIRKISEENLKILYELVAHDTLDIRIASMKEGSGIYHDKVGILTDVENNVIVFYGSANSSISGYKYNYEKIRVVKSWIESEIDAVNDEIKEFDRLWNNKNEFVICRECLS